MDNHVYPVIMSGGAGTRLWPLSRKHYPKQFLKLTSDETLLQQAAKRVQGYESPIVVCNDAHRFMVGEQFSEIAMTPESIILEPCARNTSPAIAMAALHACKQNEDAILVVLAADHDIKDSATFQQKIDLAIVQAANGELVTFGVVPHSPETGFGYIEVEPTGDACLDVKKFVEKPSREVAEQFLAAGSYYWNSGMFVFKASVYLRELEKFQPSIYKNCCEAYEKSRKDLDFIRIDKDAFAKCDDISIDYAIMEKTEKVKLIPVDVGWSDVGSFSALWELADKDQHGMASVGDVDSVDSQDSFVYSENQFVATLGIKNLVIISTKDSLLVADKRHVQDVKKIVDGLKASDRTEHLLHREVHRPWGKYDSIENGPRFQVKRIVVKPGASLSKQLHHHRSEHWIVVSGTAIVEVDEQQQLLTENQSVYIPLGSTHRLTNPGKMDLEMIEVQSGSYLGEDDIVRFEDNYGRS